MIPPWGGPRGPWSPWGPIGLGPGNIPPWGGPRGPSASGPEIYPHGGVPEAHRPWPIGQGPWSPWGPIWACIFGSCIFGAKSTLLGSQSVDSLAPWGVQTEPLFNKDCLQSFPGSLGPPSTRLYQVSVFYFFIFLIFYLVIFDPGSVLDPSYYKKYSKMYKNT